MNNYQTFEDWFHEKENYSTRAERCYDDYDIYHSMARFKNLRRWLEAAFYAGRLQDKYTVDVEGEGEDVFIKFPEELLKSQGWQEGTVLSWHDNADGTWTIKAKV